MVNILVLVYEIHNYKVQINVSIYNSLATMVNDSIDVINAKEKLRKTLKTRFYQIKNKKRL